ncbi:hypothetical protein [Psychrobacillus sp. FSL H8-0487]|uniref:hypothetical protein n=1 Tax=Psychrobacillus sp. FSL H8-0487 TaxID=2921391 RepID=UPI0030F90E11
MMDVVKTYEEQILKPFLNSYNLPFIVVDSIIEDITPRLYSLLSIWNDVKSRRAILTIGLEEATHFEPFDASIEIRALVVVAIRNSEFENLVSTDEAAMKYGFKKSPLPESSVKQLTYSSIEYFKRVDLESLCYQVPSKNNIYLTLLKSYPMTAAALRHLGSWSNKGISYPKVTLHNESLREIIDFSKSHDIIVIDNGVYVESGIEPSFSIELLKMLEMIAHNKLPMMFNDCFKSTTRNIEKIFKIIEYILDINGIFLTNNFLISNGFVSKRKELLKPMHTNKDMLKNLSNINGLNKTHLKYIKLVQTEVLS